MKKKELFTDLSDEQTEKVVGGVGSGPAPGHGANGWGFDTPFNPSGNQNAGLKKNFSPVNNPNAAVNVTVPQRK